MTAMIVAEIGRAKAIAHGLLAFGCLPVFVAGALLVLIGKVVPVDRE